MIKEFNTYLERVDTTYWNNLCKEIGTLQKFKAGEEIIPLGKVGRFLGLIKSGTVKYAAYTSEGEEKIIGLEATDVRRDRKIVNLKDRYGNMTTSIV